MDALHQYPPAPITPVEFMPHDALTGIGSALPSIASYRTKALAPQVRRTI